MNEFSMIFLNTFLCFAAFAYHFIEKWAEFRRDVMVVGLKDFIARFPAQNLSSVLASVVAFVGCYAIEWMNPGMAIACGYMGDSITRRIAGKFGSA